MYLFTSTQSNERSNACKTFQCLLDQYQIKYNRTWLYNVVLYTDQSIEIDASAFDKNAGIGNPDSESAHEDTCFTLVNTQRTQENLTVRFQNVVFVDVTVISRSVNLEFHTCTFHDSSVNMSNASFLRLQHSTMEQQRRLTSIKTNDIEEISLTSCGFNGNIESNDTYESSMVFFRNASFVQMEDVKFENITNVHGGRMVKIVNGECSIRGVTIQNNRDIAGIFLQDVNQCQVETSVFENNTIVHGSCLELVNSHVVVKHCTFSHNMSPTGAVINANSFKGKCFAFKDIQRYFLLIESTNFTSNIAHRGGALYVAGLYNTNVSHSHFFNNTATGKNIRGVNEGSGGAIYIEASKIGPRTNFSLQYSNFFGNAAQMLGGGIFVGCTKTLDVFSIPGYENRNHPCGPNSALIQLNAVNFIWNHGYFGGAFASYVTSDIQRSTFNSNSAYIGGALFLYQDKCNLTHVRLNDNDAAYSGNSISASNSTLRIEHCTIQTSSQNRPQNESKMFGVVHEVSLHKSNTYINDFRVNLSPCGSDPEIINVFESHIPDPYPDCECPDAHNVRMKNITLTCPWNYKAVPHLTEVNCTVRDVNDSCIFSSPFNFFCERLPNKLYYSGQDSYIIDNVGTALRNYTVFGSANKCPVPGGNCTRELKAAPGYWCYEDKGKKTMVCVKCPPQICCSGPENCLKFDSCADNRERTMCSTCIGGYMEPFFSKSCIPKKTCKNGFWIVYVVPVVLVIGLSLSVIFGVTDEAIKVFKFFSSAVKPFIKGHSSIHHSRMVKGTKVPIKASNHATMADMVEPEPLENDSNEISSSLPSNLDISTSLPYLMILTYMIQDFAVFHVSMYDCSHHTSPFRHLKLTIINAFQLHIDALAKLHFFEDVCIPSLFGHATSALLKEFLKVSVYFISYIVFLILYVLLCIWKPCCNEYLKRVNIKLRLVSGFLTMQFLIYQKLSSTGIKFVNCYHIKDDSVLHMDPNQSCNQGYWWWVVSWLYLIVCIIPVPLFVMVGPSLLKRNIINLSVFNFSFVVPLFSLLPCLCLFFTRRKSSGMSEKPKRQEEDIDAQKSCSCASSSPAYQVRYENDTDSERTPLVHIEKYNASNNSTNAESDLTTEKDNDSKKAHCRISQSEKNQTKEREKPETDEESSLSDIVAENLQGHFNSVGGGINWLGVVLAFRLSLVFCSLLIHRPDVCSFVLLLICLIRCFVGLKVQPYKSRYLNWFSSGSLICILLVSVCDFGMALLERIQYEDCASDNYIKLFAYIIDTFTIYIPGLCLLILASYIAVCFVMKLCKWIRKIANKLRSWCQARKKQK